MFWFVSFFFLEKQTRTVCHPIDPESLAEPIFRETKKERQRLRFLGECSSGTKRTRCANYVRIPSFLLSAVRLFLHVHPGREESASL